MPFAEPLGGGELYITEIAMPEMRGRNVICRSRNGGTDRVMPLEIYRQSIEAGQRFLAALSGNGAKVVQFPQRGE